LKWQPNDISELVQKHGLESEMYWNVLRQISIEKYWLNVSRYELVEIGGDRMIIQLKAMH